VTNFENLLLVPVCQDTFPLKAKGKRQATQCRKPRWEQFSLSVGESI